MDTFSPNTIGARLARLSTYSDTPVSVGERADVVLEQIHMQLAALAPHVKTHLVTFQSDGLSDFYDVINLVVGALEKSGFACTGDDGKCKFGAAGTGGLWGIRVIRRPSAPSLFDRPFRDLPASHMAEFVRFFMTPAGRRMLAYVSQSFGVSFNYGHSSIGTQEEVKALACQSAKDPRLTISYALFVLENFFGKDGLVARTRMSIEKLDREKGIPPAAHYVDPLSYRWLYDGLVSFIPHGHGVFEFIHTHGEYIQKKICELDSKDDDDDNRRRKWTANTLRACVSPTPAFVSILPRLRTAAKDDACEDVRREASAALREYSDWCI